MEYSAVTQPLPVSLRNGGTLSSTLAVQSTHVSPHLTRTLPAACLVKLRTNSIGRSWSLFLVVFLFIVVPVVNVVVDDLSVRRLL